MDEAAYISQNFRNILTSDICSPLLLCCIYSYKVIILSGKLPAISFPFVQILKHLIEIFFLPVPPKLRVFLKPRTKSSPMDRQTDRQIDRQMNRQTDRHTDRHTGWVWISSTFIVFRHCS